VGYRASRWGCLVVLGASGLVTGCPVAAELEDPERFPVLTAAAGAAGSAGSGSGTCEQMLPPVASGCDYATPLRMFCARGGCHNASIAAADLNLTNDPLLVARLVNVPAMHGAISCGAGVTCDPRLPTCADCMTCPTSDMLIDKANVGQSWIIKKMEPYMPGMSASPDMGCGVAMPPPQLGAPMGFSQPQKDCLIELFQTIAATGRPCMITGSGGTGGAGGGGAGAGGGAGSAGSGGGAGSAGSGGTPTAGAGGT